MNKITLPLLSRATKDSLMRSADNVETLNDYIARYYNIKLTIDETAPIFKGLQTVKSKIKKLVKPSNEPAPLATESNVNEVVNA